jgi:hypothetical protein
MDLSTIVYTMTTFYLFECLGTTFVNSALHPIHLPIYSSFDYFDGAALALI